MTKLHHADTPWKWERIPEDNDSYEAVRESLMRKVRSILNRITPTNEDALTKKFVALQIHVSPYLMDIVCIIFERPVEEEKFREIYSRLCYVQVEHELSETSQSRFRNEILIFASNFLTGNFGMKIVSNRIMHVFIADLLKSMNRNASGHLPTRDTVDNESVVAVVSLLELVGKRLEEEKAAFIGFIFFALKDAIDLVSPRTRYLILNLIDLREQGWISKRTCNSKFEIFEYYVGEIQEKY